MTIYVDESIFPFKRQRWCHLFSDEGKDELDQFAAAIGLEPRWFQDRKGFPHYDLSPGKRAAAIGQGAKEITTEEMVALVWKMRAAAKEGAE